MRTVRLIQSCLRRVKIVRYVLTFVGLVVFSVCLFVLRSADWRKPTKPRSIDTKDYNLLPEFLAVREIFVRVEQPGFHTKTIIVVTTMIDTENVSKEDLAGLFRTRWNNELDLRTIRI